MIAARLARGGALLLVCLLAGCGAPEAIELPDPDLAELGAEARADVTARREALAAMIEDRVRGETLANAHGELGMRYHAYNLRNAARWHYKRAIEAEPDAFRWHYYLGRLLQQQTDLDAANASFLRAIAIEPDDVPTLVALGEYQRKRQQFQEASSRFQKALALKPDCVYAMVGLAQIAIAERRYEDALTLLQRGLGHQPDGSVMYYLSALAYRGKGETARAAEFMEKRNQARGATVLDDPLMDAIDALADEDKRLLLEADRAMAAGQRDEAIALYRRSLGYNPNNHEARVKLGYALLEARDLAGAAEQYEAALALSGGVAMVHYNLGGIYIEQGREAEGVAQFRQAVAFKPDFFEARLLLADAFRRQGDFDGAAEQYTAAVALRGEDTAARLGRALCLIRLDRWLEARAALEDDVAAQPDEPAFPHALARLLAAAPADEARQPERAAELLEPLVKSGQPTLELAETAAMAMASLGRFDLAVNWQRRAIDLAYRANRAPAVAALRENLARYERGEPCREPWRDDDPLFAMRTYRR